MTAATTTIPRGLTLWWQAIRPKTLGMAISPVVLGTTLAWTSGMPVAHVAVPLVIVLCATAIQAGTNLFNDVADHLNGTDGAQRLGPPRITAQGWALPHEVSAAGLFVFLMALLGGLYLVSIGNWPIYALGLASVGAGYLYSHGPLPISRTAFGEVVVIAFFGIAAVSGTYYLQTGGLSFASIVWGLALGLPAGAVLLLNNVRDMASDQRAGRRTLAILVGLKAARILYGALLLTPFVLLAVLVVSGLAPIGALVGFVALAAALDNMRRFAVTAPGPALNPLLGATVRLQALLAIAVSFGLILSAIAEHL
jgi:1,4-dihydroxy-2-naphthoate octaprenyltransferase